MSQENVEIVRRAVERYNETAELDVEVLDPEVELVIDPASFVGGTYHGPEGVRAFFDRLGESFDRVQLEVDRYVDADDSVVALGRTRVHGERSDITTGQPLAWVFRLQDRRVVAMRSYFGAADALEAVGLRE
jgi:ketosteroid isomerase-like protein